MSVTGTGGDELRIPSVPWTSSPTEVPVGLGVGRRGADNAEVLTELLGLSESEIAGLEQRGVLCGPAVDQASRSEASPGDASS